MTRKSATGPCASRGVSLLGALLLGLPLCGCTGAQLERSFKDYEPGTFTRALRAGMQSAQESASDPLPPPPPLPDIPDLISVGPRPKVAGLPPEHERRQPRGDARSEWEAESPQAAVRPRVDLFFVSGFCLSGRPEYGKRYLESDAGPYLARELGRAGFEVFQHHYANCDPDYRSLLADLSSLRGRATKIVLIGHSQGGVWTHAAARDSPTTRISALVDLDTTSYGWAFRGTPVIGDPRNAYFANGRPCDLEDLVHANVVANLEVRSGERAIKGLSSELYDEQPNVAVAFTSRVATWDVGTDHSEVHRADGTTLRRVAHWLVSELR